MDEHGQGQDEVADDLPGRIAELRGSARGWHGVQLAVLGFIGLCGVLREGAGSGEPHWLQVLSGLLVLAAFGIACVATVLVALAAWPVYAAGHPGTAAAGQLGEDQEVARTSRRLRVGITLTYTAVAVLAVAGSSAWWPSDGAGAGSRRQDQGAVEVATRAGQVCGSLRAPPGQGVVAVSSGGRVVQVALADVVTLRPVDGC